MSRLAPAQRDTALKLLYCLKSSVFHSFEAFAIPKTYSVSVTPTFWFFLCFFWNQKYRHIIIQRIALLFSPPFTISISIHYSIESTYFLNK